MAASEFLIASSWINEDNSLLNYISKGFGSLKIR